ncbi:hypothetical protein F7725_010515 [Dissostichus mawsoni]|uniref:Platelet-derived growth factor C n=1 Tax=Dissostichus mawsoni TaxID=36200 RepID=A0A7J5XQ74_DISMA|nr:hypothetical protein F7725_010515 [Dissostichus mawsoni]
MPLSSPNVSKTALVSCKRRMCVVIQTITSTELCDRQPPLIQMILPLLFLLASLPQQYGSEAESSHVSKFHTPSVKEQNGVQDSHQEKIITVSGEGMVHSPDFPHRYPRNTELVWRLVAPNNMRIQLTFDQRFGLEDPEDGICKYDFVELEDLTEKSILGRWCGSQSAPASLTSKGKCIRARSPCSHPPSQQGVEELSEAVAGLDSVEEVMKFLEPERWQLDMEELYKPTWHELKRTDAIFWPSCLLVKRCGGNCACCSHRCFDCQCVPARVTKKYHEVLLLKHRSGVKGLQKSMTDVLLEHHEECACVCKDDWD